MPLTRPALLDARRIPNGHCVVRLIGKLLAILVMLTMPLGMQSAAAAASATAHHSAATTMSLEHCPDQGSEQNKKGGFVECTMACSAALPAMDVPQEEHLLIACAPTETAAAQILYGLHPDTETPPPKAS